MVDGALIGVLPSEFDKWKQDKVPALKTTLPPTLGVQGEAASV
jgi:hypothetical protein